MPVNSFENYPMSWKPTLDRRSRSLYKTLAEQLENDIESGLLKPGTKLPPQRELADFLDVNVSTISKAFHLCELKGLLSATVGSGTFVSYDVLTNGRLLPSDTESSVIDMGATIPEPSGNVFLTKMLREIVAEEQVSDLFGYPILRTVEWQKDAVVKLLARCGYTTSWDWILSANGGQNALSAVLAALFHRGDKIAVDAHIYPGIKSAAAMFGIQLVPVPGDNFGMSTEALEFVCKNEKISGVYLIPACHNPTTITMPPKRRKEIAEIIKKFQCILIEDGTYQLMHSGMQAVSETIKDQSIYIITLSKVIAPGLRIAYLSVPPKYKNAVSDALYSLNVSIVPLMAELSARVVASGRIESIIDEHKANTKKRNKIVTRLLGQKNCLGKDTDIFRWLLLPEHYTGIFFEQLAYSKGVRVYSAEKFAVGKTPPAHAVRLSICAPANLEELKKGIEIISGLIS